MYINHYKRVNNGADAKSLGQQCGASWAELNVNLKTYFIDQAAEKKIEYYKVMEKKEAYDNACEIMRQTKAAYFESRERFKVDPVETPVKKPASTSESSPEMSTSASESAQEMSTSASESA
ncbi:hypothetical protein L2E82_03044 [Cichorium intybus]|uniref:Uncharacterized protein n=3 Tax=Cichorium intybus TaxID=13427 RepID=A0ACB9H3C7_CICIN|nr:hypothetical protein L2E82_03040 [Cichorium intybus]KAI3790190.1 hypothetical protein L2E82_03042 [Cichorium intybus]KAI3790191.1 hypothetical protein L2E82_03044 [Cichorium intybus]